MGTNWRVVLVAPASRGDPGSSPEDTLHAIHAAIQARLDRVVAQMSHWRADSDISRFNRADAGTWHVLPDAFFEVLQCALGIARDSDGAYDPTVGAVVGAWGFGPDGTPRVPDARTITDALSRIGWQRIALRVQSREALQPGGVQLDLSAIAKGHGVDAVVQHLQGTGIVAALVDVGGECRGYGRKPDGSVWRVLVETAPEEDAALEPSVIALDDLAAATSGDRWHRFEHDGIRHAHTIDAHTGAPVTDVPTAVTVLHHDCMRADAWATALTVMGAEDGYCFALAHGMAARFVSRGEDGACVRTTPAFDARQVAA